MGVDCHFLLQGIFPTQESNPGLLHCRQMLYHLSHQGSPKGKLEVVKQEMARVKVDILGIGELNGLEWMNSTQMTIISTTADRNPLEEIE